jgi:UDP-glucuronate decarboxylase
MSNTSKKILVTGAAGFIGTNLCLRLLNEGNLVTGLDNFHSGQKANIAILSKHKNFSFIEHDIVKPLSGKFDQIYNLACPASPPHYQENPIYTLMISVQGTYNMLNLAKETKARFLQASTSEIYGDPEMHPQPESYKGSVNPIGPRACYDEGKRAAETLCFDFNRMHKVDIRVVRIFNTYGPYMRADDGRVVSNFICQAIKNETITLYGDGQQTRSFCYIDDMVDGLIRMMNGSITGPVNLGNPDEFTMEELAEKIAETMGKKSDHSFHPLPADDPKQRQPDIALAKKMLGWEPKIKLDRGLVKTIEYFKSL